MELPGSDQEPCPTLPTSVTGGGIGGAQQSTGEQALEKARGDLLAAIDAGAIRQRRPDSGISFGSGTSRWSDSRSIFSSTGSRLSSGDLLAAIDAGAFRQRRPDSGISFGSGISRSSDSGSILSSTGSHLSSSSSKSVASSLFSRTSSRISRASSVFSISSWRSKKEEEDAPEPAKPPDRYWCTNCQEPFAEKEDWKCHEEQRHENLNRLICPQPGCCRAFWDADSFRNHIQASGHCEDRSYRKWDIEYLGRRKHWACGFCSSLHTSHREHFEHVAEHYAKGCNPSLWSQSNLLRGLLRQPTVCDVWSRQSLDRYNRYIYRYIYWDLWRTQRADVSAHYGWPGQLQDFLEHFCGPVEDAQLLVTLAVNLSSCPFLAASGDALCEAEKDEMRVSIDEPDYNRYLTRALPLLPSNPKIAMDNSTQVPGRPSLTTHVVVSSGNTAEKASSDGHHKLPFAFLRGSTVSFFSSEGKKQMWHAEESVSMPEKVAEMTELEGEETIHLDEPTDSEISSLLEMLCDEWSSGQVSPRPESTLDSCDWDAESDGGSISEDASGDSLSVGSDAAMEASWEALTEQAASRSFEAVVDEVMEEFWILWYQEWNIPIRRHGQDTAANGGQGDQQMVEVRKSTEGTRDSSTALRGKRRLSDDESGNDDNNDRPGQPPQTPTARVSPPSGGQKFACPFRKHDPVTYSLTARKVCAVSGWDSTARLKEHLYRCHRPIFCQRCKKVFKDNGALESHVSVAREDICEARPGPPPEGMTPEQEKQLRSRKRPARIQSEEDKWCNIYSLLFPNETIPSPYFEPIEDVGRMSPDSRELDECEGFIRRHVPRLVRDNLVEVARQEMEPIAVRLLGLLPQITQTSVEAAFRQYRESRGEEPRHAVPRLETVLEVDETGSDGDAAASISLGEEPVSPLTRPLLPPPPPDSFLENLFMMAPAPDAGLGDMDFPQPMMGSSTTVFSDSGYLSAHHFCGCGSEPCRCVPNSALYFHK